MLTDHERAALDALRYARECGEKLHGCRNVDIAVSIALRDHLPDDNQPLTRTWAKTLVDERILGCTYRASRWIPIVRCGDQSARLSENATRGQFRALCWALGIQTKENKGAN